MTAWGIARWDWFRHSPKFKREGWFGMDTHAGGADKTGHFYMSYVLSDTLLWDFKRNGVRNPERNAALGALAAMTLLEIGDATSSKYGFSHEDFIADAGGVLASWWLAKNPAWDDLIDIRMEYWPSAGFNVKEDAASDYTGMKHLLAFSGAAIPMFQETPLQWLELQTGYYTRGFRSFDTPLENGPERHLFVGVGNMKSTRNNSARQQSKKRRLSISREDKKFYGIFLLTMVLITLMYWYVGGKNPFIIPTLLCIVLVWRNYRRSAYKARLN